MEQNVAQLAFYERAWAWFETHKKQTIWGASAVVVVGLIVGFAIWRHNERITSASDAFSSVFTAQAFRGRNRTEPVEAYLKVNAEYPGTDGGAYALLEAAGGLFDENKFTEALAQFQRFNREYPDNAFRSQGLLGYAACLDALGRTNEAATAYSDVIRRYPNENVAPPAKFALARLDEAQNKIEQARSLYGELVRSDPYGPIGSEAGIRLEELNLKYPPVTPAPRSPTASVTPQPLVTTMMTNQAEATEIKTNLAPGNTNATGMLNLRTNQP